MKKWTPHKIDTPPERAYFEWTMNTVTPERKETIMKSLAVLGFLAIIGFIAWASVAIVNHAPKAFTSLASIAQSLNNYKNSMGGDTTLTFTTEVTKTTTGTPATIVWNKQSNAGTYTFSYKCTDGVSVDVVDTEGLRSIACDTAYGLGDTDKITIVTDSVKQAEAKVDYTIAFTGKGDLGPTHTGTSSLTILNESINSGVLTKDDSKTWKDTVTKKPTIAATKPETSVTVTMGEPESKPAPKPAPAVTPSNPTGYSDLSTRFLSTGLIIGNSFTAKDLAHGDEGAFQFAVANLGSKTSASWTYTVTLPNGDTYHSGIQSPLLPHEEAKVALGFPVINSATYTLVVVVAAAGDASLQNNSFTKTLTFTK